jgi:hypothetical protein
MWRVGGADRRLRLTGAIFTIICIYYSVCLLLDIISLRALRACVLVHFSNPLDQGTEPSVPGQWLDCFRSQVNRFVVDFNVLQGIYSFQFN